jgi:hypothetical protein
MYITEIKFYKTVAISTLTCNSKISILTKKVEAKDRNSRNEISEECGGIHMKELN